MDDAADRLPRAPFLTWLWGARVQRVDAPDPTLFVLTLYQQRQKQCLLLGLRPEGAGVGVAAERPQGLAASAFVRRLRVLLENARLEQIQGLGPTQDGRTGALELCFARHDTRARLVADFEPRHPNLLLLDPDGRIVGAADERSRRARFGSVEYAPPTRPWIAVPMDEGAALGAGAAWLGERAQDSEDSQRKQARALAKAALKRAGRKQAAISGDLARAETAPALRREAELLLCHLATIPRGASEVTLDDVGSETPAQVRVSLDPGLSPQQNAERKFSRARKLARGATIASERLGAAQHEVAALQDFLAALETLPLEALAAAARPLGLVLHAPAQTLPRRSDPRPVHVPYRVFEGSTGARILVGKGAADNDTLTLTLGRPQDLWLHARNVQGAHVLVQRSRQAPTDAETLLDAAHLAAHFSAARGERVVEIQHTERRYVRKPKGAAPGSVRVDRERTLLLRVEPERLQRLLGRERSVATD